jgi:organic hydroperoxide reductase OsmC/OhrA
MTIKALYTTKATATGGRDGQAATADGSFSVKLATPRELGGGGGPGNNPEQLFAAGYAACFLSALKFVAATGGPKIPRRCQGHGDGQHRAAHGRRLRPRCRAGDLAPRSPARRGRIPGGQGP